ncbi:hypothetical protein PKOR_04825 [Pontibacter korlensis]|uniref:DUF4369 domain-containing protein n=1 Tax=Pontibacter korlensis TaxID=400092 RepID=A0A0E3ZCP5_9BACT|nr:hypothetical protein PKOR_04825 [Pontibacter korlensis]
MSGVEEDTWIYLKSTTPPLLDSALVKNGRFEFQGQLHDKVLYTMIGFKGPFYTADGAFKEYRLSDATVLWLENSQIILEGERGKLHEAKVTGSETQQDFMQLLSLPPGGLEKIMSFIQQSPSSSFLSVFLLDKHKEAFGREETAKLFSLLSETRRETMYGRRISEYLQPNKE